MHPMTEKKEQLKDWARALRSLKMTRKEDRGANYKIYRAKRQYRHEHIAYCLVRGRTYDEIEKPAEDNKPDWKLIDALRDVLQKKVDEANEEWLRQHPPKEAANA